MAGGSRRAVVAVVAPGSRWDAGVQHVPACRDGAATPGAPAWSPSRGGGYILASQLAAPCFKQFPNFSRIRGLLSVLGSPPKSGLASFFGSQ